MMTKQKVEKTVRDICCIPVKNTQQKKRSEQYLKVFEVKKALLNCAVVKALTLMCTTGGPKTSWKPVKRDWQDITREANSDEVKALKAETAALKETLGEMVMDNRLLKKSMIGDGEDDI